MRDTAVLKNELIEKKNLFDKCRIVNGMVTKETLFSTNEKETTVEEVSKSDNKKPSFMNKVKSAFFK